MILVVGGIKGGTGKTTLATNLAVCRAQLGNRVLLIDADDQQSSMDWHSQRNTSVPITVISFSGKDLHKKLQDIKKSSKYDDIIIDTGGRDTTSQRAALVSCDAFLAPFRPRSMDIWTVTTLKALEHDIRQVNPHFRVMTVLNQCEPRGSDKQAVRNIMEENGLECLKIEIGYRKSFSDASSLGLGVIEFKTSDHKSIKEILTLHDDIYKGNMLHTYKIDEGHV